MRLTDKELRFIRIALEHQYFRFSDAIGETEESIKEGLDSDDKVKQAEYIKRMKAELKEYKANYKIVDNLDNKIVKELLNIRNVKL